MHVVHSQADRQAENEVFDHCCTGNSMQHRAFEVFVMHADICTQHTAVAVTPGWS